MTEHTCNARLDGGPITTPANCPVCVAAVKARYDRQARALELLEACEALDAMRLDGKLSSVKLMHMNQGMRSNQPEGVGCYINDKYWSEESDLPSALIAAAKSLKEQSRG